MKVKDAYYFSHDSNARTDPKILAMRSIYKSEGYGWYWMLIEMLREEPEYKMQKTKYFCNALAMQMQSDATTIEQFINDCIEEFQLLQSDGEYIWSESLIRRMQPLEAKRENGRRAANIRHNKTSSVPPAENPDNTVLLCQSDADVMPTQCERTNSAVLSKVKESKVNKKDNDDNARARESSSLEDIPESDRKVGEVYLILQKEFGPVRSGIEADFINDLIDSFPRDWIIQAIRKAVINKARNTNYVAKILDGWRASGFTDQDKPWEVDKHERKHQSRAYGYSKPRNGGAKEDVDWTKEPSTLGGGG